MHIAAITLHGMGGRPTLKWGPLAPGLNAVYGPPRSGKSTLAGLLAHTLFGKFASRAPHDAARDGQPGDVFVESQFGRHRVRSYRDELGVSRLTVASLNGSEADSDTMRRLVGGLSPVVLAPLCAVNFREVPDIGELLSAEFARGFQAIGGPTASHRSRRTAELAARRDLLAQELETRIAGQRQQSQCLEARGRELEKSLREVQQQVAGLEQTLRGTETALAETDSRLRYRRLELHLRPQGQQGGPNHDDAMTDEADGHATHLRAMLAELARREASIRAELANRQAIPARRGAALADARAWLTVGRQLATDLAGEVARLARASGSEQCVCRDAHPRLRPITETIERQLDVLAGLLDEQERSAAAAEMQREVDYLVHSQAAVQRQLDYVLRPRSTGRQGSEGAAAKTFSIPAADVEQLETRRMELEEQRFGMIEQLRSHGRRLRELKAQRETVERERAALLSARSIEHVQRELTAVQQKLEQASSPQTEGDELTMADDNPARASDFLAQLSDGGLTRLMLVEQGRKACVVDREGRTLRVEALAAAQRDQVYLSLCLALLTSARRQGVRLPLVLDEPFERLDARGAAALATVLADFSRQGHQVVVFTGQQAAAERLVSVGAAMRDIFALQQRPVDDRPIMPGASPQMSESPAPEKAPRRVKKRRRLATNRRKKSESPSAGRNGNQPPSKRSDAA